MWWGETKRLRKELSIAKSLADSAMELCDVYMEQIEDLERFCGKTLAEIEEEYAGDCSD